MSTARRISSGSPFEDKIGYSRAVISHDLVVVSGTTGYDYQRMLMPEDVVEQCRQACANIESALQKADTGFDDIIQVRYLLPNAADFEPCWPVLRETVGRARPAATMMVVGLLDPAMKIEIEVLARRPA